MPSTRIATPKIPIPQAVAACSAFAAFSVSLGVGILVGNTAEVILSRALITMAAGFAGGFLVGLVCEWIVAQRVAALESHITGSESANVDAEGLTGVDIIEDGDSGLASGAIESESRRAGGR